MNSAILCIKFLIYTVNFVIWSLGFALLGIAVWIRSDGDFWEYHTALPIGQYYVACYLSMVIGVILLITGFLGCFGTAIDSPCLLFFSTCSLIIMFILQLVAVGFVWKMSNGTQLQAFLVKEIRSHIEVIETNPTSERFLRLLQKHLACCGGQDRTDYAGKTIPRTCSNDRTNNIHIHGCGENLRRYLEIKSGTMGGLGLGICLMEVIALLLMTCLFCMYRQDEGIKTPGY